MRRLVVLICFAAQQSLAADFISRQGSFLPDPTPWPTNCVFQAVSGNRARCNTLVPTATPLPTATPGAGGVTVAGSGTEIQYRNGSSLGAAGWSWDSGNSWMEGTGDLVCQVDSDSNGTNKFKVVNGGGSELFNVSEDGSATLTQPAADTAATFYMEPTTSQYSAVVAAQSSDTADHHALALASTSGGAFAPTRGASIALFGNEFSTLNWYGDVYISAGNGNGSTQEGDIYQQTEAATFVQRYDSKGHVEFNGTAPTTGAGSTCGTGHSVVGTDNAGIITVGSSSGSTCTLTFASAWTNTPICVVGRHNSTTATYVSAASTSAITITSSSISSSTIYYQCVGYY